MTLATLISGALRDPGVVAALREARGPLAARALLRLDWALEVVRVPPRVLRNAARDAALMIEGPRGARAVRRAELDRWRGAAAPMVRPAPRKSKDAAALERAALRLVVGERRP